MFLIELVPLLETLLSIFYTTPYCCLINAETEKYDQTARVAMIEPHSLTLEVPDPRARHRRPHTDVQRYRHRYRYQYRWNTALLENIKRSIKSVCVDGGGVYSKRLQRVCF